MHAEHNRNRADAQGKYKTCFRMACWYSRNSESLSTRTVILIDRVSSLRKPAL
jgi:hypothetical protein